MALKTACINIFLVIFLSACSNLQMTKYFILNGQNSISGNITLNGGLNHSAVYIYTLTGQHALSDVSGNFTIDNLPAVDNYLVTNHPNYFSSINEFNPETSTSNFISLIQKSTTPNSIQIFDQTFHLYQGKRYLNDEFPYTYPMLFFNESDMFIYKYLSMDVSAKVGYVLSKDYSVIDNSNVFDAGMIDFEKIIAETNLTSRQSVLEASTEAAKIYGIKAFFESNLINYELFDLSDFVIDNSN